MCIFYELEKHIFIHLFEKQRGAGGEEGEFEAEVGSQKLNLDHPQ